MSAGGAPSPGPLVVAATVRRDVVLARPVPITADWPLAWSTLVVGLLALATAAASWITAHHGLTVRNPSVGEAS